MSAESIDVEFISWVKSATAVSLPVAPLWKRLKSYFQAGLRDDSDIVDCHFALYGFAYVLGRKFSRNPFKLVVHFQGPWYKESEVADGGASVSTRIKKLIEKRLYDKADLFVVLSEEMRSALKNDFNISETEIRRIKPGVNLERFSFRGQGRKTPSSPFRICSVRRLDPRMGLDVALRALALVDEDFEYVIAGQGQQRDVLERLVRDLGLSSRVKLVGRLSDSEIVELYQSSDLSLVPTVALEGFGLVVLESLACGTPVVASRQGGLIDALEDFDPALLVQANDPNALADRIKGALDGDLPSREECADFAALHSWSSVVKAHTDAYTAISDTTASGR
ncbi:glycosyltransferase family 4 protein [Rhodococcus pyridinivorans]|uniref:glycosyltransferase family 4 protein n=1 Tax=Rhodococcus pyridinivorans TaxID=103816 RepID=UPI00216400E8|nr:glycosyltransferase family 4 protein [Rhodococcus pyridinivorans]UVT24116.1 glycosyltransferase family 4 protein [Rhodococcus pyridinivorans]